MAGGQSSSHHGEARAHRSDRERERSSSHHSRTISSTTLLLVLSLVLAVLAVMLSLPSGAANAATGATSESGGILGALNPKRSSVLISREGAVAVREAEVARREAEMLIGAPGGVVPSPVAPVVCPPCMVATQVETVVLPAQTVIKEIVKEESLTPPGWNAPRLEEIIDRELKIAEREREIGKREEQVNRREHDAARREGWIMEQLLALGNDTPQTVEEEYVYEPAPVKRKVVKSHNEFHPPIYDQHIVKTVVETVAPGPAPANTRLAAFPTPEAATHVATESSPRTTAVEIVREEPAGRVKPIQRAPVRLPARFLNNDW